MNELIIVLSREQKGFYFREGSLWNFLIQSISMSNEQNRES